MKRALPFFSVLLCVLVLPLLFTSFAYATGDVTFQVNMKIMMMEGKFLPGSGDLVYVTGDFNGWVATADTLADGNGDSIYTKTITGMAEGLINYKYYKTLRGGLDWESNPNRTYTVVAGAQNAPLVWFNEDSVYTPPVNAAVKFQVNMRVKILEGTFRPDLGDIVTVPGSMNGWSTTAETLATTGDSIYFRTDSIAEGSAIQYKFYKTTRGGIDWESISNRQYTVPTGGGVIPLVYFNDDSVVNVPITANLLFQVDMNPYEELGFFRPDLGDSVELRGGVNGWAGGTVLQENAFNPGVYEILWPYSGTSFDELAFKFRMKFDSVSAETRFPGYGSEQDNVAYEHPLPRGDGNRIYNVGNGGDLSIGPYFFSDIDSCGEIPAGDTVTVTCRVDMRSADAQTFGFNPATDTVQFYFYDAMQRRNQDRITGGFVNPVNLSDPDNDTIYTGTFNIIGPAHYDLTYYYIIKQPGNLSVSEGGGLGVQNPYRSRCIAPLSPKHFPRYFTLRLDAFHKNAPLPGENAACPAPTYAYGMADGWNMVSVPVTVTDNNKSVLYPGAVSNAFYYSGNYVPTATMENGIGYWLNFGGAQSANLAGFFRTSQDITLSNGWNMIGSVTDPTAVASITTTPGGIINSNYFGYAGSYNVATSIDGGYAYWVRASGPGTLHLLSTAAPKQMPADPTLKMNKLTITDQSGHQQVLYFGPNSGIEVSRYAMPPAPPQGAFDARFASDMMLAVVENGKSGEFPIRITGSTGMVKIAWDLRSAAITGALVSGSKEYAMMKNGSATVSADNVKLVLNGTANSALLPKEYALSQNYPNPFNPTTSIEYQLPADSKVSVRIYDIMGNEVRTLVDESQDAGYKSVVWNSTNNSGNIVASGVYFYRITASSIANPAKVFVDAKKMMLLK